MDEAVRRSLDQIRESQIVVGIDPGKTGAVARIDGEGMDVEDMPLTAAGLYQWFLLSERNVRGWSHAVAYIEHQQAWQGQGVTSSFELGRQYERCIAVCSALGMRVETVTAAVWKRHFGLTMTVRQRSRLGLVEKKERERARMRRQRVAKEKARVLAQQKWPSLARRLSRIKDQGRAEALLIAQWGLEKESLGAGPIMTNKTRARNGARATLTETGAGDGG